MADPKMKRAKIVKFRLDELAGVDAGAQAAAGAVCVKRKTEIDKTPATSTTKRAALTTAVAGHVHMLHGIDDMQSGCTSGEALYTTGDSYGYSGYHSHSWVRGEDGAITIGESAGHTHEVSTLAGSLVAKSEAKSSPSNEVGKVNTMKPVVFTESQFALYQTMSEADRESFVCKSFADREAEVSKAAAADPVIYTGELTKMSVRKSDGPLALQLAEQGERAAAENLKMKLSLEAETTKRQMAELTKRATDTLGALAGTTDAHVDVLGAIESGITDATKRAAALEVLKSANAFAVEKSKPSGFGGNPQPIADGPQAELDALVTKHATDNKVDERTARLAVIETIKGRELYAAIEKSKR